jgi:NADP-dependent 3-hydroxy acid dehydrogenase YdfG
MSRKPSVLITGASSGIGAATAAHLVGLGHIVYASARDPTKLNFLAALGCKVLPLDVTDDASMQAAVERIEAEAGTIDVLVNNAGYSLSGALETLSLQDIRHQFETNVFGLIRLTQLVLPGMRKAGSGRIVNLSSMGGRLTFPGGGAYHATKYAVEALSDALRFEVKGFGVDVIIIEPGLIRSGFADVAANKAVASGQGGPYTDFNAAVARSTRDVYEKGALARLGGTPEHVAHVIARAIAASSPRARYKVTASAHVLIGLRKLLPDKIWDRFVGASFPQPTGR